MALTLRSCANTSAINLCLSDMAVLSFQGIGKDSPLLCNAFIVLQNCYLCPWTFCYLSYWAIQPSAARAGRSLNTHHPRRIRIIFKSAVRRVALAPAFYHKQNITGGPSFVGVDVLDDPLPDACRHAAHTREYESSPAVGTTNGRPSRRNHCRRGGRAMLVPTVVWLSCRRNGVERSPVLSANSPAFKPDPFR